jgi:hypothetical protein
MPAASRERRFSTGCAGTRHYGHVRHTGGQLRTTLILALVILGTACGSSSKTASVSDFCAFNKQAEATFGNQPATLSPTQVKALYKKLLPALDHASSIAPTEIKADFQTIDAAFHRIDKELAAQGYDEAKMNPAALQALTNSQMTAAQDRVTKYTRAHCHDTTATT